MKIYGIPNCDTVQKALKWLKANGIDYEFHDFKTLGISEKKLENWAEKAGWETVLNKKSTTWRELEPQIQDSVTSKDAAIPLLREKTSMIKRPVLETGKTILFGFDEEAYKKLLLK